MSRLSIALIAAICLAAAAPLGAAITIRPCDAATSDCCGSNGQPALGILDTGAGFYVDDRDLPLGNGVWIYEESNGVAGWQRGSASSPIVPGDTDPCPAFAGAGDQLIL